MPKKIKKTVPIAGIFKLLVAMIVDANLARLK